MLLKPCALLPILNRTNAMIHGDLDATLRLRLAFFENLNVFTLWVLSGLTPKFSKKLACVVSTYVKTMFNPTWILAFGMQSVKPWNIL